MQKEETIMRLNMELVHIALGCLLLPCGVLLLVNVWAQAPQKAQIAFHSEQDGNSEIYVMDADGNNPRRLTNNPAGNWRAAWSPDGKMIAFTSYRDGNPEIYVMDADGNNPRNLTNNPADDSCPMWSPDGKMIAFHSNRDGNFEVYVMDADSNNPRNLTNNPADDCWPSWFDPAFAHPVSPAGKLGTTWGKIKHELFSR
jgi:Tol biopolymer transport system component